MNSWPLRMIDRNTLHVSFFVLHRLTSWQWLQRLKNASAHIFSAPWHKEHEYDRWLKRKKVEKESFAETGLPLRKLLWSVGWRQTQHRAEGLVMYVLCSRVYFSLSTHVLTASSTALDRSPFLPLNLSMVLNLSFFSNSSESSTR